MITKTYRTKDLNISLNYKMTLDDYKFNLGPQNHQLNDSKIIRSKILSFDLADFRPISRFSPRTPISTNAR